MDGIVEGNRLIGPSQSASVSSTGANPLTRIPKESDTDACAAETTEKADPPDKQAIRTMARTLVGREAERPDESH